VLASVEVALALKSLDEFEQKGTKSTKRSSSHRLQQFWLTANPSFVYFLQMLLGRIRCLRTIPTMNKIIPEIASLVGKTFLVTAVVVIGFGMCALLGLPSWAQGFGLIPAGCVFCWLAGEAVPPVRRWLPFLLGLIVLTFMFSFCFSHVPEFYGTVAFMVFFMAAPGFLRPIPSPAAKARREPPTAG
jgi:hypothetical protein